MPEAACGKEDPGEQKGSPPVHQAVGHGCQTSAVELFRRRVAICVGAVRVLIIGGDHGGSFALVRCFAS